MSPRRTRRVHSSLRPRPIRLGAAIPASLGLHAGVVALLIASRSLSFDPAPFIDPDQVMIVTAVALPKQTTELAQKEMRVAAAPPAPEPRPVPRDEPAPEPPPEPTPPEPTPPQVDHSSARADLLKDLRKTQAIKDIADAPEGARDQSRTSPDGIEGAAGASSASLGDPEYAAYVEQLRQTFASYFSPIQTEALRTLVEIKIDESGKIEDWDTVQESGNASFDSAALRAVIKAQRVPPPPEKFRDAALGGIVIAFSNQ